MEPTKLPTKSHNSTTILAPIVAEIFFEKAYFFWLLQSDRRKLLQRLRKKGFREKDCSE